MVSQFPCKYILTLFIDRRCSSLYKNKEAISAVLIPIFIFMLEMCMGTLTVSQFLIHNDYFNSIPQGLSHHFV